MMSVSQISAGAASTGYYKAEGYYLNDEDAALAASRWFGRAAEAHGLSGQVDDSRFADLLEGRPPNGQDRIGRIVDGERISRPGVDLTFSAPKSVSILALVHGDARVVDLHDRAVAAAMAHAERHVVQTRRQVNGAIEVVTGGGIVAGLFRHDTSRALDPQLHTHAVVANMVEGTDGRFTALRNDSLFRSRALLTEIYRTELARGLTALGYSVERDARGSPEVAGIDRATIEAFSKRRQQIEAALEARGERVTGRSAARAALATRAARHHGLDRDELRASWRAEAAALGLTRDRMDRFVAEAQERASRPAPRRVADWTPAAKDARIALEKAISHVAETRSVYGRGDLAAAALRFSETAGPHHIEAEIDRALGRGALYSVGSKDRALLTDRETLGEERALHRAVRASARSGRVDPAGLGARLTGAPRIRPAELDRRLDRTALTDGQKEAIRVALTGPGRFAGVQGLAGTGKTFMLEKLAAHATRAGFAVEAYAPSNRAVAELDRVLPGARTLQGLLTAQAAHPTAEDKSRTILLLDEASMVDTRMMRAFVDYAVRSDAARVVLVGDRKQLDAARAGAPFAALQRAGLPLAVMDDIQRQRDPETRAAVNFAVRGEIRAAFEKIGDRIDASDAAAARLAEAWLALPRDERARTGIVALTNAARAAINAHIRAGLRAAGDVGKAEVTRPGLAPLNLTRAEAGDAQSYRVGDAVLGLHSIAAAGLQKGTLYEVAGRDPGANRLTLQGPDGAQHEVALGQVSAAARGLVAFERREETVARGDRVVFRLNDRDAGIRNGDRGIVLAVNPEKTVVAVDGGTLARLDAAGLASQGMELAYASTAHGFQGATVDRIMVLMYGTERLADQKSFYVALSRARDEVRLFTDDPEKLADRIERTTGEKPDALKAFVESWREREEARERSRDSDKAERDRTEREDRREAAERETAEKEKDRGQDGEDRREDGRREAPEDRIAALTREIDRAWDFERE
jgi:conjugative relaxase-like TrwC/TraI family protein